MGHTENTASTNPPLLLHVSFSGRCVVMALCLLCRNLATAASFIYHVTILSRAATSFYSPTSALKTLHPRKPEYYIC
jgi:hypothetical protein